MFEEIGEQINSAVHRIRARSEILSEIREKVDEFPREPNPFSGVAEKEYVPMPIILRATPTMMNLKYAHPQDYPRFEGEKVELSNDFLLVEPLRDFLEASLAKGFGETIDMGRLDSVATQATTVLKAKDGGLITISATDNAQTLGSMKRDQQTDELRTQVFTENGTRDERISQAIKKYQTEQGGRLAQWVHRSGYVNIGKCDAEGNLLAIATYARDGTARVQICERKIISPEERRHALADSERFINQEKFREYRQRHPDFKKVLKGVAGARTVEERFRLATPAEETEFMQDILKAKVDEKATKEKFEEQKKQYGFLGVYFNRGRVYWLEEKKREWYQS